VDLEYCTSVRERTFHALGIKIGHKVTCAEIVELENHHWKHAYGVAAWDKEKIRLDKVTSLIKSISDHARVKIVGFGADSREFIEGHPDEAGRPDLEVWSNKSSKPQLLVEVTGTERMRGSTYWVRPDKLTYAKQHPDEDVWVILHYGEPSEKFIFIKPDRDVTYDVSEKLIRGSTELYIEFTDDSTEVVSFTEFSDHLQNKFE